jgi:hypothetical protein
MSTELQYRPFAVAEPIQGLLAGLRRRIRSYIWIQGIALAVAWVGLAFWITLALDWMIEPPPAFRVLLLVGVAAVLLWIVYRYILARMSVPMGDTSMAVLLERRYRGFRESLITTVELGARPAHAEPFSPEMLAHTHSEALAHSGQVRLGDLLRNQGLMRAVFAAIVLTVSVGAFALAAPEEFQTWVRRVLLMSEELWPRKTRLSIEGFEDGVVKVPRGGDFRVVAYADRAAVVPETVQIRYRTEEGNPGRETMAAEAFGPGDDRQAYSHNFPSLLTTVKFDIVGGDDRLRDYTILVVDNPTVSNMTLHCVYPDYMRRSPRDLPVTGLMQVPLGTKVTIRARANKPLEMAKVERVAEQGFEPVETITRFTGADGLDFNLSLPPLVEDQRLQFKLFDTDQIVGRNPVRLDLTVVADEPPKVALQLRGIGSAITTQARLPVFGEVTDDYGIERIWFEYQVDQGQAERMTFLASPDGRETLALERERAEVLDLKELQESVEPDTATNSEENAKAPAAEGANGSPPVEQTPAKPKFQLKEEQELTVSVKAQDQSTLEGGPFIGVGEKYQLEVVAPDRLLAILEARELMLRQQFETIIEEFSATRDLLARTRLGSSAPGDEQSEQSDGKTKAPLQGAEPEDALGATKEDAAKTPEGDAVPITPAEAAAQARASQLLGWERIVENSERAAHETRSVGTAFHEILEEMSNNRIDTPALAGRLRDEIADPLLRIADRRMPVLQSRLVELQKLIDDRERGSTKLDEAVREADAILLEMRDILDKMIEMATYKELVEKLRKVIEQQDQLNKDTKQQQVERLKSLIEE